MSFLLDYFFPITTIEPTPAASTAFLKQVCVVVKPTGEVPSGITLCTTKAAVAALTDNADVDELFDAGMGRVYVLVNDDLDIASILDAAAQPFYTLIISSDFSDSDVTTDLDIGTFAGVVALSSTSTSFAAAQAAISNRCAMFTTVGTKAKNLCYAFGKLLSAATWRNQQYITMPYSDGIDTLGDADSLFDDRVSFVLDDPQFGIRLAFFVAGGKAITAPYIKKNFEIDMQSAALTYVSGNQPAYTRTQAALIEDELTKVIDLYVRTQLLENATVEVLLEASNFVATGNLNIAEPKALWKIQAEMRQTL